MSTNRKLTKEEKELRSLMKKVQKKVKHKVEVMDEEQTLRRARHVDVQGEKDWTVQDVDADTLFREMKRRDF